MTEPFVHLDVASAKWKGAFPKMPVKIEAAVIAAFEAAQKPGLFAARRFQIDVILTDDATIRRLNKQWRAQDKPTNVLSFPQFRMTPPRQKKPLTAARRREYRDLINTFPANEPVLLGDVILAFQTILRESKEHQKPLENHVAHLVVHGTLHLLGYDHMLNKDAGNMGKLECDILESLGYPDPYRETAAKNRKY